MPGAQRVTSPVAQPAAAPSPLAFCNPTEVTHNKDGSWTLEVMLNRSYTATVNLSKEGATYQQKFWAGPAQPAQKLTAKDAEQLANRLTEWMRQTPGRQSEYSKFNAALRKAFRAPPAAPSVQVAKIPTHIVGPNADASVSANFRVGGAFIPGPSTSGFNASMTVRGTGFNDAPPKFGVSQIDVYAKDSGKKIASFPNPKAHSEDINWGEKAQTYGLEVPMSSVAIGHDYYFVATTSINGAKPQQVRSEPTRFFVGM